MLSTTTRGVVIEHANQKSGGCAGEVDGVPRHRKCIGRLKALKHEEIGVGARGNSRGIEANALVAKRAERGPAVAIGQRCNASSRCTGDLTPANSNGGLRLARRQRGDAGNSNWRERNGGHG